MSLNGKKFVITGSFEDLGPAEVTAALADKGATVAEVVNRSVDAVLAGKKADDELVKKARAYGIPILARWQYDGLMQGQTLSEMAELGDDGPREFDKGRTVKILSGAEGVGMIGEIFWWGPAKFGAGMRAGIDGIDGEKYWIDEKHLGWPDEEIRTADEQPLGKGSKIAVVAGEHIGQSGEIFWWGPSKFGPGMRAGVNTDDDQTIWVSDAEIEAAR